MPIQYSPLTVTAGQQVQVQNHLQYIVAAPNPTTPTKLYLPLSPVPYAPLYVVASSACTADSYIEIVPQGSKTIDGCSVLRLLEGMEIVQLVPDSSGNWRCIHGTNVGLIQVDGLEVAVDPSTRTKLTIGGAGSEFKDSMDLFDAATSEFEPVSDNSWDVQFTVTADNPGADKYLEISLAYTSAPNAAQFSHRFVGGIADIFGSVSGNCRVAGVAAGTTKMAVYAYHDGGAPINVAVTLRMRRKLS